MWVSDLSGNSDNSNYSSTSLFQKSLLELAHSALYSLESPFLKSKSFHNIRKIQTKESGSILRHSVSSPICMNDGDVKA